MAALTGFAFASNCLIRKIKLSYLSVKTTRMTANSCSLRKTGLKLRFIADRATRFSAKDGCSEQASKSWLEA
jgi:hypothetical protein